MGEVKAWSFSALNLYEQCPAKFMYAKIMKLEEPVGEAMMRGRKVHKIAEDYLTGKDPEAIPPQLEEFEPLFKELFHLDPIVEQKWGFTRDWQSTGWFAKGRKATWLRVVLDALVLSEEDRYAWVIDHKTGKPYGDNKDQMELFALSTFCRYPWVETVETRLWYLDTGDEQEATFTRDMADNMLQEWEERVEPLLNEEDWAPRPNRLCNWCHFRRSNGGPCKYA